MVLLVHHCHRRGALNTRLESVAADRDPRGPVMESYQPASLSTRPRDADCLTALHTAVQEADARHIFRQLLLLVDYLHRVGVAHRNVKLESIALEGNRGRPVARLIDLGPAVLPHASIKADGLEPASHVGYTGAAPPLPASSCFRGPRTLTLTHHQPRLAVPSIGVGLQLCVSLPT